MTASATQFTLLPAWNITQNGKSLLISGGADAKFEVELDTTEPSFFSDLKPEKPFTRRSLSARDQTVLEELLTAEIVVPQLQPKKQLRVSVIGDKSELAIETKKQTQTTDLLVIARVNSTYAKLLEKINYADITTPHLFIDIAYHHTLSVGPLVFPGETACVACLQGRIGKRWGDEEPPQSPMVAQNYAGLVSELVKAELEKIKTGDTSLTNKTVSWNFQDRLIRQDQLLKVPLCPICTRNVDSRSGALVLPWEQS